MHCYVIRLPTPQLQNIGQYNLSVPSASVCEELSCSECRGLDLGSLCPRIISSQLFESSAREKEENHEPK